MGILLNLPETEAFIAEVQRKLDSEGSGERYQPLTPAERRQIKQGLMVVRTEDMGRNFASYSPNMPGATATGSTYAESLRRFHIVALGFQRTARRGSSR